MIIFAGLHIIYKITDEKFSKTDSDNAIVSHLRDISMGAELRKGKWSRDLS